MIGTTIELSKQELLDNTNFPQHCSDVLIIPDENACTITLTPTIEGAVIELPARKAEAVAHIILHRIQQWRQSQHDQKSATP